MSENTTASTYQVRNEIIGSWEYHLRARNLSPRTIETYMEAVSLLQRHLESGQSPGGKPPDDFTTATKRDIEGFLATLHAKNKPATVANRYRSLKRLYAWLEAEAEIETDPMIGIKPPMIPDVPVPVLSQDQLVALLATCGPNRDRDGDWKGPPSPCMPVEHPR